MTHLDGNALAGPLAEFFTFDVTMATARCEGCGTVAELARAMVYPSAAGTVVRCATCDNVLMTLVEADDRAWIGFSGVGAIEVRRPRADAAPPRSA
jgi:ribosomal protein S27E